MLRPPPLFAPILWTAYVLIPAGGWGFFHGIPIHMAGAALLFMIWWTWRVRRRLPGRWLLATVVVVKLIAGSFLTIDRGLQADYFANAGWMPPIERSTEFGSRSYTRVDRRLSFGPDRGRDFPLYFFNDLRFNSDDASRMAPDTLPFSVTWQGVMLADRAEDRRSFFLRGRGVTAEMWIDGTQAVHLNPNDDEAIDRALWSRGLHRLTVRLSVPEGATHEFEAGFIDGNGARRPFDASNVIARPYRQWRLWVDAAIRPISVGIDALTAAFLFCIFSLALLKLLLAVVLPSVRRSEAIAALAWIPMMAGAILFAQPAVDRVDILSRGQDFPQYESIARDILLNGRLVHQPLYGYLVAATHLVFGEALAGLYLVQWLLACAALAIIWTIAVRMFGIQIWKSVLAVTAVYFFVTVMPAARLLVPQNLLTPLLVLWAAAMIDMARANSTRRESIRAGVTVVPLLIAILTDRNWSVPRTFVPTPLLTATWMTSVIGVAALIWGRVPDAGYGRARFVPFAISVSYALVVTFVFRAERMIIPPTILLLPYAALGIWWTTVFLVPPEEE